MNNTSNKSEEGDIQEPSDIHWEASTKEKFDQMIRKVPIFLRTLANEAVAKKAEEFVKSAERSAVTEKDMVDAFFEITPFGFHGPMKCDMEELGIDYQQYGHPA